MFDFDRCSEAVGDNPPVVRGGGRGNTNDGFPHPSWFLFSPDWRENDATGDVTQSSQSFESKKGSNIVFFDRFEWIVLVSFPSALFPRSTNSKYSNIIVIVARRIICTSGNHVMPMDAS